MLYGMKASIINKSYHNHIYNQIAIQIKRTWDKSPTSNIKSEQN